MGKSKIVRLHIPGGPLAERTPRGANGVGAATVYPLCPQPEDDGIVPNDAELYACPDLYALQSVFGDWIGRGAELAARGYIVCVYSRALQIGMSGLQCTVSDADIIDVIDVQEIF